MDDTSRQRIEQHLATLLETSRFRRARLQAATLKLLVEAHLQGKSLSTRDLARGVYDRDDEEFLRATRQLTREIRVKLELIRVEPSADSVEFRLHETRPELIVRMPKSASQDLTASAEKRPRPSRRIWLAAAAVVIVLAVAALVAQRAGWLGSPAVPCRVDITKRDFEIRDQQNERLPEWEELLTGAIFEQLGAHPYNLSEWLGGAVLEHDRRPGFRMAFVSALPERPYDIQLQLFDHRRQLIDELRLPWLPDADPDQPTLTELGGDAFEGHFKVFSVSPIEFDGDPSRDELLVSVADSNDFPCQVLVLGFDETWSVLLNYWNMGHAFAQPIGDLDGDGRDEIAVYGQNNSYLQAFLTLLSAPDDSRSRVGRSPAGARRAGIVELEALPPIGVTLRLPRSALAVPKFSHLYRLRSESKELFHEAGTRELRLVIADGAGRAGSRPLHLDFKFDFDQGIVRANVTDYFDYLELLKVEIGAGRLEDRWHILETDHFDEFSRELESQIVYWDDRDPEAGWQPLDMTALQQRFAPSGTTK